MARLEYLSARSHSHPNLGFAFFVLNVLVLTASAVATVLAHDPVEGFDSAQAGAEKRDKEVQRLRGEIDRGIAGIRAKAAHEVETAIHMISLYRTIVDRRRTEVPRYFFDVLEPAHSPTFFDVEAALREVLASGSAQASASSANTTNEQKVTNQTGTGGGAFVPAGVAAADAMPALGANSKAGSNGAQS